MSSRFTVSLDDGLSQAFDAYLERLGYSNRSEAVRDLIREALAQESLETHPEAACVGVLTYLYDHEERDLSRRLTQVQHAHHSLTLTTLHTHLDHDHCLEAVLLQGCASEVQAFGDALMSRPGIRHGRLHRIPFQPSAGTEAHGHRHEDESDSSL